MYTRVQVPGWPEEGVKSSGEELQVVVSHLTRMLGAEF